MPELVSRLSELVADELVTLELKIPQTRADLIARLHREADIRNTEYIDNDVCMRVRLSPKAASAYRDFVLPV
jgi:50S ribosomal subunit-associated GTPase HflX